MSDQKFGKEYKLCSKKLIDELFNSGSSVKQYPLRMLFCKMPAEYEVQTPFQIVFAVPKKKIRAAHDRNYVKRMLREIFRKNKRELEEALNANQMKLALFLIYSEKEIIDFSVLEKKTLKLIQQLILSLAHDKNE
jgi:ribonuclease P protein component